MITNVSLITETCLATFNNIPNSLQGYGSTGAIGKKSNEYESGLYRDKRHVRNVKLS